MLRPSFSVAKKSFRHAEAFFRASKSSEKWGSSSCRTPFPGFPHTPFRPVDERFPLFWLAQKPPHLLRRFLSYPEGWGAYTVRERTGCIMRGKVLLLRRGTLLLILTALVAAGIFMAVGGPGFVSASAAKRQLPIYSVEREEKVCAISFDAAWGNEDTQALINILGKYNVKATFFVVGDWVDKYPESVKALHDAGHEVMNHSLHHDHYNALTADQVVADVTACNEKIAAITGVTPCLIRCPYGEYDDHVISAIRSMGMEPIQWDVDSLDWKDYDADTICQRVTSKLSPGSIVLFHNAALHTPEALPAILDHMTREGYSLLPISQLIYRENYTIDHAGRQFCQAQSEQ